MLNNFTFKDFKNQLAENKQLRLITYTSAALLGGFILYIGYYQFIWTPSNEKSKDAYWAGLNYASKDSTDLAIQELGRSRLQRHSLRRRPHCSSHHHRSRRHMT